MNLNFYPRSFYAPDSSTGPSAQDLKNAKEMIETVSALKDAFISLGATIKTKLNQNLVDADEYTKQYVKTLRSDVSSTLISLGKRSDKLLENQLKLNKGQMSSKDISKQIQELDNKRLKSASDLTTAAKNGLIPASEAKKLYLQIKEAIADGKGELEGQLEVAERTEKAMGTLGSIVKGLNKIPILGNLIDSEKVMEEMQKTAAKTGSKVSVLATGFKEIGKSVAKGLTDPLTIITFLVTQFNKADKQATELGKSLGISKSQSLGLRNNFAEYSRSSSDTFVTTDRLMKAQAELSNQLGIAVKYSGEEAETFSRLTELVGLSADEAGRLSKFSAAAGMSNKEYVKQVRQASFYAQQTTRTHFSDKEILQDVSKLSAGILTKFQNNPKAIAEAVVQAKALGLSLEQVDKTGESLLNFESSIESELKAELITGKQLNFEKARAAALTGDQATLMQEIANQAGSLADFQNMNVIAQKSLAEAFGMSRDEMSDMLMKQEAISKYGDAAAKLNKDQLEDMKRRNMSADEYIQKQNEQRSIQDKFNDAVLKLQDILGNLVTGPFSSILTILNVLTENAGVFYTILGSVAALLTGKMLIGLGQLIIKLGMALGLSVARAAAEVTAAEAISAGAVTFAIVGGLAAVMGAMYAASKPPSETKFAKGGIVTSEINNATIGEAGPEAIIPLNSSRANNILGGGENIDLTSMISAINEVKSAINSLASRPSVAYIQGKDAFSKEINTTSTQNSYRTI
jgi:hypothetical protein